MEKKSRGKWGRNRKNRAVTDWFFVWLGLDRRAEQGTHPARPAGNLQLFRRGAEAYTMGIEQE